MWKMKLRLPSARILAVSATICNPDDISAWLGAPKALTFDSSYRPVPLRLEVVGFEQRTNDFIFDRNLERELRPLRLELLRGEEAELVESLESTAGLLAVAGTPPPAAAAARRSTRRRRAWARAP